MHKPDMLDRTLYHVPLVLILFLLSSSNICVGDEEPIGTLRGVSISGDVVWENEQIDEVPVVRLWTRITKAVYAAEIERLEIEVSDDELAAENKRIQRELGFTVEMAAEIAEKLKANKKALTAWLASPEDDLEIYERILAPLGTRKEEWEALKQYHGTPEKVEKLRDPKGPEEILEAGIGNLREELLNMKLAEHILDREITADGARWDAHLASRDTEPNSKKAREARYFFIRTEVSLALRDWVARMIAEKELVIENEKFKALFKPTANP